MNTNRADDGLLKGPSGDPDRSRRDVDSPRESGDKGVSEEQPTSRQQQILDAYFAHPNAAAVGRTWRMSERNVRRVIRTFGPLLEERRREQERELLVRAGARTSRVQDWADASIGAALKRLDELVTSSDDRVALQAIKMTLETALRGSSSDGARPRPELDDAFRERSGEIIGRLEAIPSDEREVGGADHE